MSEKIVRINMSNLEVTEEKADEKYKLLGGRALTSTVIKEEVPADCNPLRKNNKIIIAPGLLTGTSAPASGRLSIGGKSPLTGTIKEANAGGICSQKLARLGIKALILEGQPKEDKIYTIKVTKDSIDLEEKYNFKNLGVYQLMDDVKETYGDKVGMLAIGPAGEMLMQTAGITNNDMDNEPSRYAARGGLGAVMGSKGVKAIIIDDTDAPKVEVKDEKTFKQARKKLQEAIKNHPVTSGALPSYGTAGTVDPINESGGLPTENFKFGQFEGASNVSGAKMAEIVEQRGGKGKMGHACHPGCTIRCSNIYPDKDGNVLCSPLEYETDWALGPNLKIDDLDIIAKLNRICNDVGIDTIETGCTIGVLMEAGVLSFGDGEGAIKALEEVGKGTPLGRIIGMGAVGAGNAYGITRVPSVKGQGMPAYDPRAMKGIGVTYATGAMGADHTFGYTIAPEIFKCGGDLDPLSTEGKVEASRDTQKLSAFIDSVGLCLFVTFATSDDKNGEEGIYEMINAMYGSDLDTEKAMEYGRDVLKLEREFNKEAGFTPVHDRLPEFMYDEELPPHNEVYNIPGDDLDKVHQ
ncbi:aldehyde ferredoxin oxidoreductase family protein [Natranaerofaba carboxydovora]|uniref:aldehyde ferredoxin oxidoreductase family protein n=1 Tax=Natranaerofaba carboxydovora TaxID=2742683 RepID=UPI001F13A665|nr:aldehyde ferredoxin oxidoreductase C-terminal domain-containing protein [Natranaerofaba carboxydovora]UMZ73453.1 putative oxidoreductase YdhV [Natranaerofaba carboxydovora]